MKWFYKLPWYIAAVLYILFVAVIIIICDQLHKIGCTAGLFTVAVILYLCIWLLIKNDNRFS